MSSPADKEPPRAAAEPIWTQPPPGQRRPRYTREQIAEAALRIADSEGYDAVSMRRVAAELGAGTMTLYHYVRTKQELMALMSDAIMGELLIPDDEVTDSWRDGLAEIARRTRAIFARHPWVARGNDEGAEGATAPNTLKHVEQSLAVAARTGLGVDEQFELIALVDDYVFGYVTRYREGLVPGDAEQQLAGLIDYLEAQLATGEFPHLQALGGGATDPREGIARVARLAIDERRFERGLQILLDGIEQHVRRTLAARPG